MGFMNAHIVISRLWFCNYFLKRNIGIVTTNTCAFLEGTGIVAEIVKYMGNMTGLGNMTGFACRVGGGVDTGKRFYVKTDLRNEVLNFIFHPEVFKI